MLNLGIPTLIFKTALSYLLSGSRRAWMKARRAFIVPSSPLMAEDVFRF